MKRGTANRNTRKTASRGVMVSQPNEENGVMVAQPNDTHYADKPIVPKEIVYAIDQTIIQQVQREKLTPTKWRDAHKTAESRYFPDRSWLYDIYDDILL